MDSGDAALIEATGESWIKPRETLSEYSYVRGATHEVAVDSDRVKQPAGLAASDTSLFVADNARTSAKVITAAWKLCSSGGASS